MENLEEQKQVEHNSSQETLKVKETKPFNSFNKQTNLFQENNKEKTVVPVYQPPVVNCHMCFSCLKEKSSWKKEKKNKEKLFAKESNVIDLNQINEKEAKGILQYHQKRQKDLQGILKYSQFLNESQEKKQENLKEFKTVEKPQEKAKETEKITLDFHQEKTQPIQLTFQEREIPKRIDLQQEKINFSTNKEDKKEEQKPQEKQEQPVFLFAPQKQNENSLNLFNNISPVQEDKKQQENIPQQNQAQSLFGNNFTNANQTSLFGNQQTQENKETENKAPGISITEKPNLFFNNNQSKQESKSLFPENALPKTQFNLPNNASENTLNFGASSLFNQNSQIPESKFGDNKNMFGNVSASQGLFGNPQTQQENTQVINPFKNDNQPLQQQQEQKQPDNPFIIKVDAQQTQKLAGFIEQARNSPQTLNIFGNNQQSDNSAFSYNKNNNQQEPFVFHSNQNLPQ